MKAAPTLLALMMWATPALADVCNDVTYLDVPYTICEADLTQSDMRLFLYAAGGAPYGHFSTINRHLAEQNLQLFQLNLPGFIDRFEDVLDVHVNVERKGVKSLTIRYEFFRGETRVAHGRMKTACCLCRHNAPLESIPIPPEYDSVILESGEVSNES